MPGWTKTIAKLACQVIAIAGYSGPLSLYPFYLTSVALMKGCKLPVFVVGAVNQVHKTHRKGVSKARVIIITGSLFVVFFVLFFSHMEMWSECMVFSSLIRGYCDPSSGVSLWHFIRSYWGLSSGGFSVAFHQELLRSVIRGVSLWHFIRSYWGLSSGGFSVAFHQELLRSVIRFFFCGISLGVSEAFH